MEEKRRDLEKRLDDLKEHEILAISCMQSDMNYCNHILCRGMDEKGREMRYFAIDYRYRTKSGIEIGYQICFFKARKLVDMERI